MSAKRLHPDDSPDNPDIGHNRLPWLIGEIRSGHQEAIAAARNAVERACHVGRLLIEAKALAGHGGWLEVLKGTDLSPSSAAGYMRLARLDPANLQRLSHLSLRLALRAIARHRRVDERDEEAELAAVRKRIEAEELARQRQHEQRDTARRSAEAAAHRAQDEAARRSAERKQAREAAWQREEAKRQAMAALERQEQERREQLEQKQNIPQLGPADDCAALLIALRGLAQVSPDRRQRAIDQMSATERSSLAEALTTWIWAIVGRMH